MPGYQKRLGKMRSFYGKVNRRMTSKGKTAMWSVGEPLPEYSGKSQVGNRSRLRAAKLLGIYDGKAGVPPTPLASAMEIGGNSRNLGLRQTAYNAGYLRGQTHKTFLKARRAGRRFAVSTSSHEQRVARRAMTTAWRADDQATIHGFVAGLAGMGKATYRGRGRNTGSFKGRAGQWKKGPGGRFVGSK